MTRNKKLLKYGKLTFIALVVLFVAVVSYNKLTVNPKNKLLARETAMNTVPVNNSLNDSIVDFGMEFLGTPYVAAGCSKDGFDCSGFVYFVYQHFDITVPRSSADFEHFGKEIPIDEVQKGDLLLFLSPTRNVIGHIGIVSTPNGMKSDFIHASSGRQMSVILTSLTNEGYTRRFVKAIRVL